MTTSNDKSERRRGRTDAAIPGPWKASAASTDIQSANGTDRKAVDTKGRGLFIVALVLFAGFSLFRIFLAEFPKTIDVMPDELRYLDLARSLFDNGSLIMRGETSSFQKILYSLSLFPALFFNDTLSQVKAIGVLNSLYLCSSVFPALLLAKRIFTNRKVIIACLVLTLIMPDMCYSMTFMSECIYFPLALWLIWLAWAALTATGTKRNVLSLVAGMLCYATYLGKEVAAAFAIAFLILSLIEFARQKRDRQGWAMAIGCFLIGFFGPFVIMKLTLFSGMANSYNQTAPEILESTYTVLFAIYALAVDSAYYLVGFAFFPLFFVLLTYRDLPRDEKKLFLFCLIAFIVGLLTVVYTISIREDVGHEALRQHVRYVIPLFMPLLFLFIRQIAHADTSAIKRSPGRLALLVGTTVGVVMLIATMFGTANLEQGFDNSQFHVFRWFNALFDPLAAQYYSTGAATLADIATNDGSLLAISPGVWLSRFLVIAFIVIGTIGLLGKRRIVAGAAIVGIIAVMMVANNVIAYQYNMKAYSIDQSQVDEVCAIDEYLEALPEGTEVLIVNDAKRTGMNNLTDTYIANRTLSYRYITADNLASYLSETGVLDQNGVLYRTQSSLNADDYYKDTMPSIDYILVNDSQNIEFLSNNVEKVAVGTQVNFQLYHVTNADAIALTTTK